MDVMLVDQWTGFNVPFVMLSLYGTLEVKVRRKSQRVWMVTINEDRNNKNGGIPSALVLQMCDRVIWLIQD
jgi:hypothetical protein